MHLAVVTPFPPAITGIGQYGFHTSRSLSDANVFDQISVLAGASNGTPAILNIPHVEVEYPWRLDHADAGMHIMAALQQKKPDVVWFNLGVSSFGRSPLANLSGFSAVGRTRKLGIPTVVTLHEIVELSDLSALQAPGGIFAKMGARLITRMALQADVICLTLKQYTHWLSEHDPHKKSIHIPIGSYHEPDVLTHMEGEELLFFSTFAPFKGIEILIAAYERLLQERPNLTLTIAGAEHHRFPGYAQTLIEKYSELKNIRWLVDVPEDSVRSIFERASIVVLPYSASTGSSSVLYQAATWGKPIIASDLPELRSAAKESGLNIAFFQTDNADDLAVHIKNLFDHPEERMTQLRQNAERIQNIHPQNTAKQYIEAFNLALSTTGKTARLKSMQEPDAA
ncbi:MAG: glycosyltransferase [Anaerolineae bacterium]|nr:glycosyltransferase [Anaerolineae bacterium]